jgi:hypothetical protein
MSEQANGNAQERPARDLGEALPERVGLWILAMVVLGVALTLAALASYRAACPYASRSVGTVCKALADNPPWTAITGLATAPALILVWYWRTVHRQADVRNANQQQISARFAESVRLLSDRDKLEARHGAIYSLARIANDSKSDHGTVIETLAAFVREYAPILPDRETVESPPTDAPPLVSGGVSAEPGAPAAAVSDGGGAPPATDVQAALTVIGRLGRAPGGPTIDLRRTFLRTACLSSANLSGADLRGADLSKADLHGADLSKADLRGAKLMAANLRGANLSKADLRDARLTRAHLRRANLSRTPLMRADLHAANLSDAFLCGANLMGADLREANLTGANLRGAEYDRQTAFPTDFRAHLSGLISAEDWRWTADVGAAEGANGDPAQTAETTATDVGAG